jgi:hypothetical protein
MSAEDLMAKIGVAPDKVTALAESLIARNFSK